uniref:Uncharacterized protein n=1 Tax=Cryptomonas curvata TaxID=233186 RepID=A0A7S0QKQ2_9CRYP
MSMPRARQLALVSREKTIRDLSGFSLANPQSLVKSDGYLSASAYRHTLESSAEKGQKAYVTQWKAKNLAGAFDTVKKAAALYSKWDVVDPYTGVSRDDLTPFPSWNKKGKLGARAPHLPDPETKSRTQQLLEQPPQQAPTQQLLAPVRFQLGSADYDKLRLFEKEGFPIQMPDTERKRLDALVRPPRSAAKAATTQLYIPTPFLNGAFRNVEQAAAAH